MKEPTILIGADGVEYVVSGGKIRDKSLRRTRRDESAAKIRKEVCADCGKVLIYNADATHDPVRDAIDNFRSFHGREPNGLELSAMM